MDNILLRIDDHLEIGVISHDCVDSNVMQIVFGLSTELNSGQAHITISVITPTLRVEDSGIPDYNSVINHAIGRLKSEFENLAEKMGESQSPIVSNSNDC